MSKEMTQLCHKVTEESVIEVEKEKDLMAVRPIFTGIHGTFILVSKVAFDRSTLQLHE